MATPATAAAAPSPASASAAPAPSELSWLDSLIKTSANGLSGAIAGAVSRTATSPLERLKVMQQVQSSKNPEYKGIVSGLRFMYKNEGWRGLFRGNGTNVARIAPNSALQFLFFDVYKAAITTTFPSSVVATAGSDSAHSSGGGGVKLTPLWTLSAGALAGSTASLLCYPLDLVRSYLTVQTHHGQFNGIWGTLKKIHANDGVRGLFKGSVATLAGITPYIAINFFTFDSLKRRFLPARDDPSFTVVNLLLGGASGGVAALVTYPTDLVRRRVQLQGVGKSMLSSDMAPVKGAVDCVKVILRTDGIPGLYRGLTACLLKVIPSMAIAFSIHERLRLTLDFDYSSAKRAAAPKH